MRPVAVPGDAGGAGAGPHLAHERGFRTVRPEAVAADDAGRPAGQARQGSGAGGDEIGDALALDDAAGEQDFAPPRIGRRWQFGEGERVVQRDEAGGVGKAGRVAGAQMIGDADHGVQAAQRARPRCRAGEAAHRRRFVVQEQHHPAAGQQARGKPGEARLLVDVDARRAQLS